MIVSTYLYGRCRLSNKLDIPVGDGHDIPHAGGGVRGTYLTRGGDKLIVAASRYSNFF